MNPEAWTQLAIQAPVVLIFGGMVYLLMREQAKAVRENAVSVSKLIDTFMGYMDKRDDAMTRAMDKIVARLDSHDDQARVIMQEARSHDSFVRDRFKELGS
jgi:3-phosphoglycerate kinase